MNISRDKMKLLLKEIIVELLEERPDLVRQMVEESLESIAMSEAIKAGDSTPMISAEKIENFFEQKL
jgi:hypothetical protein